MLIDRLAASLSAAAPYRTIAELLSHGEDATLATPGLIRPALTAAFHVHMARPTLVVVSGEEAAERYWRQTAAFLGRERVLRLPERSDLPWADVAPDLEEVGARARALYALDKNRRVVVVSSARALLRTVPPHGSRAFDPDGRCEQAAVPARGCPAGGSSGRGRLSLGLRAGHGGHRL